MSDTEQPHLLAEEEPPLEIQLLSETAKPPRRALMNDAGYDLFADEACVIAPGRQADIALNVAGAPPPGYWPKFFERSGLALKHGVQVLAGVVDPPYRGGWRVILRNGGPEPFEVKPGDRIAQMVLLPHVKAPVKVVPRLDETERGDRGFGSTGR